jgi:DNA polymerase-3 subunit delta
MEVDKIISDWKKKNFKPLYWLEGRGKFYIDKRSTSGAPYIKMKTNLPSILRFFMARMLLGRCDQYLSRYPMFSERQVVLLKEAQQMRDVEKLEPYVEKPPGLDILIVLIKKKK